MSQLSQRDLVIVCHLLGLAGFLIPFGHIVAPLVWWSWKRSESPVLDIVGRDVLNFQISMTLCFVAAVALFLALVATDYIFFVAFVYVALFVFYLFCMVKAAIQTFNHKPYFYPLTISFLR